MADEKQSQYHIPLFGEKMKTKMTRRTAIISVMTLILAVGVFLRTYHFQAWLEFDNDQARDATLVSDVVTGRAAWPLLGPTMRGSADSMGNLFHVGPIYYYFQILSAKTFGNYPDKLAYPDLFFSILTIPLLYLFLRKYFEAGLSLGLTALYAVSYFAIEYSRFAWNPNSIPFFTILFLFSLYEFLLRKSRVSWWWAVAAGIALGVGVQLHVVTLLLFAATAFFVFAYLLAVDRRIWLKIVLVVGIVLVLNAGQIVSEFQTGFLNSKILAGSILNHSASSGKKNGLGGELERDIDCQTEAGPYILSSAGQDTCAFAYASVLKTAGRNWAIWNHNPRHKKMKSLGITWELLLGTLLFWGGYALLFRRAWKETDPGRRIFLRLVVFYAVLSFLIMLPVSTSQYADFRYLIQIFFLPFLFLGLLVELLRKYSPRLAGPLAAAVIVFLIGTNFWTMGALARQYAAGDRSNVHFAVLGEMEKMVDYMIGQAQGQKTVYLVGDRWSAAHFFHPFLYLAAKQGADVVYVRDDSVRAPAGSPIYYLTDKVKKGETVLSGYPIENCKTFGRVVVCKL